MISYSTFEQPQAGLICFIYNKENFVSNVKGDIKLAIVVVVREVAHGKFHYAADSFGCLRCALKIFSTGLHLRFQSQLYFGR